jgi:hypothetical protein
MTKPQNFLGWPQKILFLAAALVFVGHRGGLEALTTALGLPTVVVPAGPAVDPASLTPAFRGLYDALRNVSPEDRDILRQYYSGLSRSVANDPVAEPVLATTSDLRRAHRAGLLFLWTGMAGNKADKYAGLSSGLAGVLTDAVGDGEVPLNPAIRQSAVACFDKVASLCTNARP